FHTDHPVFSCSKIEQKQLNTWVSFQSAEQPLLGQFSVSGNNLQDHEGTEFIEGARKVWEECQHLGLDDAFAGHAYSYLDLLEG
ncbi:hypothetical protein, partial [Pseudomonas guariconensis]|uniref:hypothetical protein n=1 Tax=Pseudomonas guariconensis TaxID=1288410 RepID=UPI002B060CE9